MSTIRSTTPGPVRLAVLRFELRQLIRDRALLGLGILLLTLTALGLYSGWRWFAFQQNALDTVQAHEQQTWHAAETQARDILSGAQAPPRGWWANPADVRGFAYYLLLIHATKPPSPLTALSVGQSDLLPYYLRVGPGLQTKLETAYEAEHPRRLLLGRFDLAFVALFVFPLLLLAATYNALACEREAGRLAFLGVHGVSPRILVTMRIGLRASALSLLFVATVLAGVAITRLPVSVAELAAWLALSIAYFLFWTALVMVVVSATVRAPGAALWLAALWLLLLVIVPGMVNLGAGLLHPLPSRTELVLAARQATDAAEQSRAELLGRYLHDHPELTSVDTEDATVFRFAANIAADDYVEQQLAVVQQRFDTQLQSQQRLIERWQWLSPAVATQLAMTNLAGAGHAHHRRFLEQIAAYTAELRAFFHPPIMRGEYQFDEFDDMPRWQWAPAEGIAARSGLIACLGALLGMAILGLALAIRRLRRVPSV